MYACCIGTMITIESIGKSSQFLRPLSGTFVLCFLSGPWLASPSQHTTIVYLAAKLRDATSSNLFFLLFYLNSAAITACPRHSFVGNVMSSIVTAIPSGSFLDWCVQQPWIGNIPQLCYGAGQETDFETICCDGEIVDTSEELVSASAINLADVVCCRIQGPQPIPSAPFSEGSGTKCTTGTPVPLASLAATNIHNAQEYLVTYTTASFSTSSTFVPLCLWVNTASGQAMMNVTVPGAQITTLSGASNPVGTAQATGGSETTTASATRSTSAVSTSGTTSSTGSASGSAHSSGSAASLKKLCYLGLLAACAISV
jgi:hypothetical protein